MKRLISLLILITIGAAVFAQEETLFVINGQKISANEFERIYLKNNSMASENNKSVEDYFKLFVNFKLKVVEAENQGLDTLPKFKREYSGYKQQLERPYFTDKDVTEALIKEAYERQYHDVRASHILITMPADPLPADTLRAYNQIKKIKKQLEKGADFDKLALKYSKDPSVSKNKGDLGYFTVFQMVYPFENLAYNTPVGEISDIVRTRYGYHILKVTDKRKALGQVKVAHIMVALNKNPTKAESKAAKEKINMIYGKLQKKEPFRQLAQLYSDDKNSAKNGGELQWFGTGRMVPVFEKAAFSLDKKGDFSAPFQSDFGWHIVGLLDKKDFVGIPKDNKILRDKVSSDMRAYRSEEAVYSKIKKDYGYELKQKNLARLIRQIDTSIFSGKWDGAKLKQLEKPLLTLDKKVYTLKDFVEYLKTKVKSPNAGEKVEPFVQASYRRYLKKLLKDTKIKHLPENNPEYKYLLQEYHDGILLFDLTDQEVWKKAVEDSIGLTVFYEEHKQDYMWGTRVKAEVFETKSEKVQAKLMKFLKKRYKKSYDLSKVLSELNKKDSTAVSLIKDGLFAKGDYAIIDEVDKTKQFFETIPCKLPIIVANQSRVVYISEQFKPEPKALEEAKGKITADYQDKIEKEWVESLRKKYKVEIKQPVLEQLKNKYK